MRYSEMLTHDHVQRVSRVELTVLCDSRHLLSNQLYHPIVTSRFAVTWEREVIHVVMNCLTRACPQINIHIHR